MRHLELERPVLANPSIPEAILTVGRMLPSIRIREYYFIMFSRLSKGIESEVSSSTVENRFREIEAALGREPDPTALAAIRFHAKYYHQALQFTDMQRIQWYYEPTPNHISEALTNNGRERALFLVARAYLSGISRNNSVLPWKEQEFQEILRRYHAGNVLPEVILSERPFGKRPDGNIYILDGVHRLLALAVDFIQTGQLKPQTAYVA